MVRRAEKEVAVGFNVDSYFLNFNEETLTSAQGVAEIARTLHKVRKLGAQSIIFTAMPEAVASPLLDQVDIAADRMYGEVTSSQVINTLAQGAIWAYVSDQPADMKIASSAQVRAIGVAADNAHAKALWHTGADDIVPSWNEFIDIFDFAQNNSFLKRIDAIRLSGASKQSWQHWYSAGLLPIKEDAFGQHRYPRTFVEHLKTMPRDSSPRMYHAELCGLEWMIQYGSRSEKRRGFVRLRELEKQGEVLNSIEIAQLLGYEYHAPARWAAGGFLPAIKVGGKNYSSRRDVELIKAIMDGFTCYEAAEILGVTIDTVSGFWRNNKLAGVMTPTGLRFDPAEVNRYKDERDALRDFWQVGRVKQELGMSNHAIMDWGDKGILPYSLQNSMRVYDPADVLRLKEQRATLNAGFEWLADAAIENTYSAPQAAEHIHVRTRTLADWGKEGLLPFFDLTPPGLTLGHPLYPKSYIDALVAYAGALPVSKQDARAFYEMKKQEATTVE